MTIATITTNTFKGYLRERVPFIVLIFAFLMIASSYVLSPLAVGAQKRIIVDAGLASVSIFGVLLIVLLGAGSFHQEKEKGILTTILSKPVSRVDFILGKYFGTVLMVALTMFMMSAVFLAMMIMTRTSITSGVLWAIYLSIVEVMLITAVMVFFASFSTPVLSSFFTICAFVAGHLSKDILALGEQLQGRFMGFFTKLFFYLLPNLALFNLRPEAVHDLPIPDGLLLAATTYGLFYAGFVLVLSSLIFRAKEID